MANRYFEGKEHSKLYLQYRLRPPSTLIEKVVNFLKDKYKGDLDLAIDVGCGSGQNTLPYADHFKNVIGFDVSSTQIETANDFNEKNNVSFKVSPAEKIDLADGSVQLITVMTAVHWFDIPKFLEESRRLLCPGGVLAILAYGFDGLKLKWDNDHSKDEAITELFKQISRQNPLLEFWAPQIAIYMNHYRDITIPMEDFVRDEDTCAQSKRITLAELMGEVRTWSAFQRLKAAKGEEIAQGFLADFQTKILEIIGENEKSPDEIEFTQENSYILLMARKGQ